MAGTKFVRLKLAELLTKKCLHQSLSSNRRGVKKSACLKIVYACMNRSLQWRGSRAQKYVLRHSNIFSLCYSWEKNESIILQWRRIYLGLLNRFMGDFCSYTRKQFSGKPIYWRRNYYLISSWSTQPELYRALRPTIYCLGHHAYW